MIAHRHAGAYGWEGWLPLAGRDRHRPRVGRGPISDGQEAGRCCEQPGPRSRTGAGRLPDPRVCAGARGTARRRRGFWGALLGLSHWNACSYIPEPTPDLSLKPLAPGLFSTNSGAFRAVIEDFWGVFGCFSRSSAPSDIVAQNGVDSDATIAELLGHARRGVTQRHYIRRPDAALVAAADRVASRITAALDGRKAEVVPLRSGA